MNQRIRRAEAVASRLREIPDGGFVPQAIFRNHRLLAKRWKQYKNAFKTKDMDATCAFFFVLLSQIGGNYDLLP